MILCRAIGVLVLVIAWHSVRTQPAVRDSSYTIQSTYEKLHADYPFISPIENIPEDRVSERPNVVYTEIPRPLTLDVFYPGLMPDSPAPAVLLIHGGGWRTGVKSNLWPMARRLAAAGFIAFVAEYRLSGEATFPAAVDDLKNAVAFIRSQGMTFGADSSRLVVLGCSAGAQLATLLGTRDYAAVRPTAIVNIDGIVSFDHPESEEGTSAALWLGGTVDESPETWAEASPLNFVERQTPPVLFINSAFPRFHAGRDDMISILESFGTYSEVHTLADSPHAFWLVNPWFEPTVEITLEFLKRIVVP